MRALEKPENRLLTRAVLKRSPRICASLTENRDHEGAGLQRPFSAASGSLAPLALLFLLVFGGCKSAKPAQPAVGIGWRPAGAWSGQGNAQTESFDIASGQFRIKWETSRETSPGAGQFRVTVRSGVSGRPLSVAVDHHGLGRDVAYVTDDPRPYYLEIESRGVDWSVRVEEAVVGTISH